MSDLNPVNRARIAAFYREFQFLGKIIPQDCVRAAGVKRVDSALLNEVPHDDRVYDYSCEDIRIWIVGADNEIILEVRGDQQVPKERLNAFQRFRRAISYHEPYFTKGESVHDALLRIGNTERIGYIVQTLCSDPRYHRVSIVVYKFPHNFTMKKWSDKEIKNAVTQVKKEVVTIDAAPPLITITRGR